MASTCSRLGATAASGLGASDTRGRAAISSVFPPQALRAGLCLIVQVRFKSSERSNDHKSSLPQHFFDGRAQSFVGAVFCARDPDRDLLSVARVGVRPLLLVWVLVRHVVLPIYPHSPLLRVLGVLVSLRTLLPLLPRVLPPRLVLAQPRVHELVEFLRPFVLAALPLVLPVGAPSERPHRLARRVPLPRRPRALRALVAVPDRFRVVLRQRV